MKCEHRGYINEELKKHSKYFILYLNEEGKQKCKVDKRVKIIGEWKDNNWIGVEQM